MGKTKWAFTSPYITGKLTEHRSLAKGEKLIL
jgi:hypothetical protein